MPAYTIKPTPLHTIGLDFNGTSDAVDCGSNASLDNLTTYTLFAVFKADTLSASLNDIAAKYGSSVSQGAVYCELDNTGRITTFWSDGGAGQLTRTAASAITTGRWYRVVTTMGNTAPTNKIYIDGADATSTNQNGGTLQTDAANNFQIGKIGISGGQRFFDGIIGEVAIWKEILPITDIVKLGRSKSRGLPLITRPATLRGYWALNDYAPNVSCVGRYLRDQSIYNNRGTGVGGSLKAASLFGKPLVSVPAFVRKGYKRRATATNLAIMTPRQFYWGAG